MNVYIVSGAGYSAHVAAETPRQAGELFVSNNKRYWKDRSGNGYGRAYRQVAICEASCYGDGFAGVIAGSVPNSKRLWDIGCDDKGEPYLAEIDTRPRQNG